MMSTPGPRRKTDSRAETPRAGIRDQAAIAVIRQHVLNDRAGLEDRDLDVAKRRHAAHGVDLQIVGLTIGWHRRRPASRKLTMRPASSSHSVRRTARKLSGSVSLPTCFNSGTASRHS